jgi:predicted RNA-binding Zn-ribbon protein involved in translation (DUF1610 family)
MVSWIKREKNWLRDIPRHHQELAPAVQSQKPPISSTDACIDIPRYGVVYYSIRCPRCRSTEVKTHTSTLPLRYHKCKKCGFNFKSREASEDQYDQSQRNQVVPIS